MRIFFFFLFLSLPVLALEDYEIVESEIPSTRIGRSIPYWAMIPKNPESLRIPVVYFLHGRGGNRHHFRDVDGELVMKAKKKKFAVVALTGNFDGKDTYWVNDVSDKNYPMKDVVLKELIPAIEKKHAIGGLTSNRLVAGISMGSHGAYQLALSSGIFRCVAGHSLVVRNFKSMTEQFPGKFGTRAQYGTRDPLSLLKNLKRHTPLLVRQFWVDIGGKDDPMFLARATLVEKELLRLGKRPGDHLDIGLHDPEGKHDFPYWKKHMPEYIDWYGACFGL